MNEGLQTGTSFRPSVLYESYQHVNGLADERFVRGKSMKMYVAAAVAALTVAAPAAAEVVVLNQTISTANAPAASTVSFAQFDPSLGVLQSVSLAFEATSSTTVNFSNNTPNERTFTVNRNASATLTGNGFALSDTYAPGSTTFTLAPRISNSTPRTGSATYTAQYADSDILGSNFAAFIGLSSVNFNFARAANFSASPGGATVLPTSFGGNATLTYTYEVSAAAVPEPAAWAMMIGGFGMLGAAARRRARATVTHA